MRLYLLAGLGFDQRTFQRLKLEDQEVHYLDWIDPKPNEKIEEYAQRMLDTQIDPAHLNEEIVLAGHSFGGVLVQEIWHLLPVKPRLVVVMSSIKSHSEKAFWMRWFGWLPIYWLIAKFWIWLSFPIWARWFGYKTAESRKLFKQMVSRFSNRYYRWAIRTVTRWHPKPILQDKPRIVSIHGKKDSLFFYSGISQPKHGVEGANHFMPFLEADEVSHYLLEEIKKLD